MVDIHIARAARELEKPPSKVTKDERAYWKKVNLLDLRKGLLEDLTKVYQIFSLGKNPTREDIHVIEELYVRLTQYLHGPSR